MKPPPCNQIHQNFNKNFFFFLFKSQSQKPAFNRLDRVTATESEFQIKLEFQSRTDTELCTTWFTIYLFSVCVSVCVRVWVYIYIHPYVHIFMYKYIGSLFINACRSSGNRYGDDLNVYMAAPASYSHLLVCKTVIDVGPAGTGRDQPRPAGTCGDQRGPVWTTRQCLPPILFPN